MTEPTIEQKHIFLTDLFIDESGIITLRVYHPEVRAVKSYRINQIRDLLKATFKPLKNAELNIIPISKYLFTVQIFNASKPFEATIRKDVGGMPTEWRLSRIYTKDNIDYLTVPGDQVEKVEYGTALSSEPPVNNIQLAKKDSGNMVKKNDAPVETGSEKVGDETDVKCPKCNTVQSVVLVRDDDGSVNVEKTGNKNRCIKCHSRLGRAVKAKLTTGNEPIDDGYPDDAPAVTETANKPKRGRPSKPKAVIKDSPVQPIHETTGAEPPTTLPSPEVEQPVKGKETVTETGAVISPEIMALVAGIDFKTILNVVHTIESDILNSTRGKPLTPKQIEGLNTAGDWAIKTVSAQHPEIFASPVMPLIVYGLIQFVIIFGADAIAKMFAPKEPVEEPVTEKKKGK